MERPEETVSVQISFKISFHVDASGWWHAQSRYGATNASSKAECIRILSERAMSGKC